MSDTILNFESFEPRVQQAIVFSLYEGLRDGAAFLIQNSNDTDVLFKELRTLPIPSMHLEYLEQGPTTWRIRISKNKKDRKEHVCCCDH